jgi:hypothetical protein
MYGKKGKAVGECALGPASESVSKVLGRCVLNATEVSMTLTVEVDLPADLARFHLPEAVAARLQTLLDHKSRTSRTTSE